MQYTRIVLNEPHASIEGLYDDYLFHGYRKENIRTVRFPYSRFIVDAERLWNDPLEAEGQGILYKQFDGYLRMIPQEYEEHLLNLWHNHQERLRKNLCPEALLLDCHSFPSEMSDVDICIGYNEDWSKPNKETIELAVNLFEDCGYKVGINEPYSNSETPECPFIYQSMMLEVNKKTYMEDGSLRLKKNLSYRKTIHDLVTTLMSELSV